MNSKIAAVAVMLFASWTSTTLAGNSQSFIGSGVIHITGSIVESPCESHVGNQQLTLSCTRNNQTQTRTMALRADTVNPQRLPANLGSSQLRWLDSQHKLGILTVSYQ